MRFPPGALLLVFVVVQATPFVFFNITPSSSVTSLVSFLYRELGLFPNWAFGTLCRILFLVTFLANRVFSTPLRRLQSTFCLNMIHGSCFFNIPFHFLRCFPPSTGSFHLILWAPLPFSQSGPRHLSYRLMIFFPFLITRWPHFGCLFPLLQFWNFPLFPPRIGFPPTVAIVGEDLVFPPPREA